MRLHARSVSMFAAMVMIVVPFEVSRAAEEAPAKAPVEKAPAEKADTVIEKGSKVSLEYTLTLDGTVDATQISEDARKVGTMLMAQGQGGQQHPVRVAEVKGDTIELDHNHPLAGKKLHFAIKVLSIE